MKKQEPLRFSPRFGSKIDPDHCRASVHHGRSGNVQCTRKPKPGTEWCGSHTIDEVAEGAPCVWAVDVSYGGKMEVIGIPIAKETKKQIKLVRHHPALHYHTTVPKRDDGTPLEGYRSRREAVVGFVEKRAEQVKIAKTNLNHALKELEDAERFLDDLDDEEYDRSVREG